MNSSNANLPDGFRIVRITRTAADDRIFNSATEASLAAGRLSKSTGHEYAIAHASYPLDANFDQPEVTVHDVVPGAHRVEVAKATGHETLIVVDTDELDRFMAADPLTIYAPDGDDHWTVSGDLREVVDSSTDSTNYLVENLLVAEGWKGESLDPEFSCFFGYTDTEDRAIKLKADAMRLAEGLKMVRS